MLYIVAVRTVSKMKQYFAVLAVTVTLLAGNINVAAQLCDSGFITGQIVLLGDGTVSADEVQGNDPGLSFFREAIGFNDAGVEQVIEDAMNFFQSNYGLDFSQSEPNQLGERVYMNATFFPYRVPFDIHATYNPWIVNPDRGTKCFASSAGGFMVNFFGDQLLRGSYGGSEGRPVMGGEAILDYGFYSIPVCRQSPITIRRVTPIPNEERRIGFSILFYELFHRNLGQGTERGVFQSAALADDENRVRTVGSSVLTFPTTPLLVSVL